MRAFFKPAALPPPPPQAGRPPTPLSNAGRPPAAPSLEPVEVGLEPPTAAAKAAAATAQSPAGHMASAAAKPTQARPIRIRNESNSFAELFVEFYSKVRRCI